MDGRNNQFNPHNTQSNQLANAVPAELARFVQNGVTPEQFAENSRQLETYNQMNAMALQVYLQRQSQQAEQRRQDELRVIQLAQQLASGSQQRPQLQQPPPAPLVHHNHHSIHPQPAVASNVANTRTAPVQIHNHGLSYHQGNTVASQHWPHPGRVHVANVQHQQHSQSVNTSARLVNHNVYPPRDANRVSRPIRGTGGLTASNPRTPQVVQPPKPTPLSVPQTPQHSQYSGMAATGSHVNTGFGHTSAATAGHAAYHRQKNLQDAYTSWLKSYGDVKAASMAREHMQSWQQGRQLYPTVPISTQPTAAGPMASASTQNSHNQSQFQVPQQEEITAPYPHPQTREWHSSVPVISTLRQQAASPPTTTATSSTHAPLLHPPTDNSFHNKVVNPAMLNVTDTHNDAEMQSHHPEAIANNPTLTSAGLPITPPALSSSQSGPTQSILLTEEKGSPLYTMRGLAASIKRSLNAERLAASLEPSASSLNERKRKRSSSVEAIDDVREVELNQPDGRAYEHGPFPKEEPQPVSLSEPDDSRTTILPTSFHEVTIPQHETMHTPMEFLMPNPQHESTFNFVPFSTLTGAVSFDDISNSVSANNDLAPPSEAAGVLEDLTTAHLTPEAVLHNPMEDPLIRIAQPTFEPLSFPHRTQTPPLAATITPVHDEDEVDEEVEATPSSPSPSLLHEEEVDSQLRPNPSGGEDDTEMRVGSDEGHVQAHFDITPPLEYATHYKARDELMQEADVFVRRTGLLDSSIVEIDRGSIGNLQAEGPSRETSSSAQVSEELPRVLTNTSSTRDRSTGSANTSGSGSMPQVSTRSRRKREFYIEVPPPSEWVLRAKHREAERKALMNEKSGQHNNREYTECKLANRLCPRHCHWNGCQAILNSIYALKQHVRQHQLEVEPVRPAMTVSCQWKQCRMVCERSSLLLHLNRHIDKEVACVYDDCDKRFSRFQHLAEHEKREHADDEPAPSAVPQPPDLKPLATLPQTVPSYTTTTQPASMPSITAERHARLGPWALKMIIGHPSAGPDGEGSNAGLRALRTTRLTEKSSHVVLTPSLPRSGERGEMRSNSENDGQWAVYDVVEEPCVGRGQVFGELDSVDVTREFYEGWKGSSSSLSRAVEREADGDSLAVEALL